MTVWTCSKCTYLHESIEEKEYLRCAICSEPKPTTTRKNTAKKRQGKLLQHFAVNGKQQCTMKEPAAKKGKQHPETSRTILDVLKPSPASSFVARARYRDDVGKAWQELESDEELPKLCPLTVVREVLPSQVAARLLEQLENESATWNRGIWIVHGKAHSIPRTVATYNLNSTRQDLPSIDGSDQIKHDAHIPIEEDGNDEYHDQPRHISQELREAANCVVEVVKQHCPWTDQDWEPSFAFANCYANGQECVGWHSDHIMKLGPRPIIVGLTLGACRRFDMRQHTSDKHRPCRHVSVPLPHNSLCIMWNDAQESWQHSVPRCSDQTISRHSKVGLVRISLTFRSERKLPNLGTCHCGHPAGLKAKEGKYYLFCIPYGKDKRQTCNFWKSCRWADEEAKRLTLLEGDSANER